MSLPPIVTDKRVALARSAAAAYACTAPFHPPERYPEFAAMPTRDCDPNNHTYAAVRDALALLFGPPDGPEWNPLAQLIQPGDTVVLKPNFIKEHHETRPNK